MQQELDFKKTKFFGDGYYEPRDKEALVSQLTKVFNCLRDGENWSLSKIEKEIGAPQASISAAIRSLRNEHYLIIEKRLAPNSRGNWLYSLKGKMDDESIRRKKISNLKPIGDKQKFAEFMRSAYAYAMQNSDINSANLTKANQEWLADFINRIKEKKLCLPTG